MPTCSTISRLAIFLNVPLGNVAVVEAKDFRAVAETRLGDLLVAPGRLVLAERDAGRADAVVLDRVAHQRAPAAADVEERLARLEHQLSAHEVHLLILRLFDGLARIGEEAGRVDHARAQKGAEEVVAAVVVPAHELPVVGFRVNGELGYEFGEEVFDVRRRKVVTRHRVAIAQEQRNVPGNVEIAVEIGLEERIDRNELVGELLGQRGVAEIRRDQ